MTRRAPTAEAPGRPEGPTVSDRDRELLDYLIELTWTKILRDARARPKAE